MRTECGAREDEGAHLVDREILQFVGPAPYLDGRVEAALEKLAPYLKRPLHTKAMAR